MWSHIGCVQEHRGPAMGRTGLGFTDCSIPLVLLSPMPWKGDRVPQSGTEDWELEGVGLRDRKLEG